MKKIKLKKKRKINGINLIAILLFSIILSIILLFIFISNKTTPKIENYAEIKAKKIISAVFSKSVTDEVIDIFSNNNILVTDKNNDGEVSSIDFNSGIVNNALMIVSKNVKDYLKKIENGDIKDLKLSDSNIVNVSDKKLKNGIIYEFPSGIVLNSAILANIGPKIPVKLSFLGDVTTEITTDIKDYGINNAVVEIGIKISVTEQMILPFSTKEINIETIIPVAIKLIQGSVPNYYFNGKNNPLLTLDSNK